MKRKTLLLLMLMALFAPLAMNGQNRATVSWGSTSDYSGTTSGATNSPFGRYYGWEYKVFCYRPNTLSFSGNITEIAFLPATTKTPAGTNTNSSITINGVADSNPMQIWMKDVDGNTSLNESTTFSTYVQDATKVYSGNIPATTDGTMASFTLSTSFNHSQEKCLLIMVRTVANSTSGDGSVNVYYKTLSGDVNLCWYKQNDDNDPGVGVEGTCVANNLPVIRVTYTTGGGGGSISYCTPSLSSTTTSYYISNFTTTGGSTNINNTTSGAGHSYSDFYNTHSLTAAAGSTINFTITIAGGGTHGSAIWVDWNNDGDFSDDGERVHQTSNYESSPHSGSFTVPANATAGDHRMRIVTDYYGGGSPSDPCSADTGEFEDYKLTVSSNPYITLAPTAATIITGSTETLTATYGNVTGTPTITYTSSNTNVATVTGSGTTATVTAVAPGTATITARMNGSYTATCAITVEDPSYCTPAPTSIDYSGITNVKFGVSGYMVDNNTHPTSSPFYGDYTSQVGTIYVDEEATIKITFNTHYDYNTYVWVDLNKNYSFEANEVVCYGTSLSSYPTTLTLNFTIPANQTLGDYRMRIGAADSGLGSDPNNANPCYNGTYGVFEDYTLRVVAAPTEPSITLAPETATLRLGSTLALTATVRNVSDPTITYTSSDNSIATVSGNGTTATVTSVAEGTVTITASMSVGGTDYTATSTIVIRDTPIRVGNNTYLTWEEFIINVRDNTTYSGQTIYLLKDITITDIVPGNCWNSSGANKVFKGTFDGQGYTITINHTATQDFTGLFRYTYDATIKNLRLEGTITSNYGNTASVIGMSQGTNNVENVISNVTINSTATGVAGMIAGVSNYVYFRGCAFTGQLNGTSSEQNGGFVGRLWNNNTHSYTNCLFAPSSISSDLTGVATFDVYESSSFSNSYYTQAFGTEQGKQAYTVTGVSPVNVTRSGNASNTYNVSGIAAYSPGLNFTQNNITTIYAGSGETIGLTLSGSTSGYRADHGTLEASDNDYTLTMEAYDTKISVNSFTITATADPAVGGTVSINNGTAGTNVTEACNANSNVTLTATTNTGYTFTNWTKSGSEVSSNNPFSFTATEDATYVANFTREEYTITLVVNPTAGGTVSAEPAGPYHYNDEVTITATANDGYTFGSWSDSGAQSHTVTITGNATYTATFTQNEYTLTLTAEPAAGGTVSASPAGPYHYNDEVTITATAEPGYTFGSWSDSGAAQHTITITENTQLTAYFGADQTLTTYANPIEGGYVTIAPVSNIGCDTIGTTYTSATAVGATTTPFSTQQNYSYQQCLYLASEIASEGWITSISYEVFGNQQAQNDHIEVFMKNTTRTSAFSTSVSSLETITASDKVFDGTWNIPANGWATIVLDRPFYYDGYSSLVIGIHENSPGYTATSFVKTDCASYYRFTCYSMTDDMNPLNLNGSSFSTGRGKDRANVRLGFGTYHNGESIALTAHANPGYQFTGWTVDGTADGNTNPYNVTMNANHNVVANFEARWTFVHAGNWNVPTNWLPVGQPGASDDVYIEAAAIIPANCTAEANTVTINGGSITIEDGGQLQHNNSGVTVTTQKSITGYGSDNANTNKGYYLISSPVDGIAASNVTGLQTSQYDLYKFVSNNEENGNLLEWVHVGDNGSLVRNEGYIYASRTDTRIKITGTVLPSNNTISKTLTYNNGYRFGGWNLIGNPFVCNAYVNVANYYILNDQTGYDEFVATDNSHAIAPMSGLMVVATAANQSVTYSRTAPSKGSGILNIDARKTIERGTATLDRARVRFGEGEGLQKFQFNPNHTKVYIPQDGSDYAVVYADGAGTIPVNFKAQDNGRYTLDFSTEEVSFNYLHLIDNMNGNDVDLLQTPYYAFDAKSTDFASRFTLVFATGSSTGSETGNFAFFNNGVWIINNPSTGSGAEATLQVVDVLGHILSSETISGSCSKAINVAPGVYMLRLINGNDVKVQKVVVKR